MKFNGKVALALLGMICLSVGLSAQLYWVGGNSSWNNSQAWSLSPNGSPCNCIPDETTDVVFNSYAAVSLNDNAKCRSIIVQSTESFSLSGNGSLTSFGDFHGNPQTNISIQQLRFDGPVNHNYSFNSPINAEVTLLNGTLVLNSNAFFSEGLNITHGDVNATGRGIVVSSFTATDSHSNLFFNGTKVVVEESIDIHPSIDVVEFEETIWPGINANPEEINAGNASVAWNRATTCGTGVGQTPFTITASVASDYNGQDISCNGFEDGQATVSVVGGVGPFSYIWIGGNSPGNQQNYNNLGAGTYTVLVNDLGQGITCVDNVQLSEPPQLTVFSFFYTPPTCEDQCNGSGTPIVIGGVQPYDFTWSSGETTQTATQLCNGPNTLEFTDLNGCAFDTTFNIIPNLLLMNLTLDDALCFGEASGSAIVNPSGGQGAPYLVTWSDNSNGNIFQNLSAGTYSVVVQDAAGCEVDSTFSIAESTELLLALDLVTPPTCPGEADGSIEVTITGGVAPYNTAWTATPGFTSSDEDPTGLAANTYSLEVIDDNGCIGTLDVIVADPAAIAVSANITDAVCFGGNTGAIDVTITGGAPGYVVGWTGPNGFTGITQDISNLAAGDYTITVTDQNLCSDQFTFTVGEPTEITVDSTVTQISCNGENDGEIELIINGGSLPYLVVWSGPNGYNAVGLAHNNLAPGDYSIVVTDALNCQTTVDITLVEPTDLVLQTTITPMSCNGADDAAIDLTITGGGNTYFITWSGPSIVDPTLEDQSNLAPGAYAVEVLDDLGCTETSNVNITEPLVITTTANITDVSCGGFSDGEIDITISGGTAPYSVVWSGPFGFTSVSPDITNLIAGDYTVSVTDFAGCLAEETFTIIETLPLDITLDAESISCFGADDASIDLTITGGLAPIVIAWAGPLGFNSSDEDLFDLGPGIYDVLVTDANNCFRNDQVEIIEPDEIVIDVVITEPLCNGEASGAITLNIAGGVPPFNVVWSTGDGGLTISDLIAGVYSANIIDDAGCQPPLAPITINEPDELELTINTTQPDCATNAPGLIEAVVTGGTTDYTYQWTGPNGFVSADPTIADPEDGNYDLTVVDAFGCQVQGTTTILTPVALDVTTAPTNPLCEDDLVSIDVTILNGTPAFNVLWTLPGGGTLNTEDITTLPQGTYELLITDLNNCIYEETFDLTAIDPLSANGTATPLDCSGDPIGTIDLTISGGQQPYIINWTSDGGFTSTDEDLTTLSADHYTATITDALNCSVELEFTIDPVDELIIDGVIQDAACAGDANGSINLTLSGGIAPYDVIWTSLLGFSALTEDISNLAADIYTATVTDNTGCENTAQFEVTAPDPITSGSIVSDVLCADDLVSVDVSAFGGQAPYIFNWTFPNATIVNTEDLTDVAQGAYTLNIEDQAGCSVDETFDLTAQNPLAASGTTSPLDCTGNPIASIDVTVTSGVAPFNFDWTGPNGFVSTDEDVSNLEDGNYTVNITDDQGCLVTLNFTIDPVDELIIDGVLQDVTCAGESTGNIDLTLSGGIAPYNVVWTSLLGFNAVTEDISNLPADIYTATVTDNTGCENTAQFEITEPDPITSGSVVSAVLCADDLVSVDVSAFGGQAPYIFNWTFPDASVVNTEDLTDVAQGTYSLNIEDQEGCSVDETFDLTAQNPLAASGTTSPLDCTGNPIASIDVTVTSGVALFNFDWTGPSGFVSTDEDVSNLEDGDYTVSITDDQGCLVELNFTIDPVDALQVNGIASDVQCFEFANGSILLNISGGVAPYLATWTSDNGYTSSDFDIFGLEPGNYEVTINDDNGCVVTADFVIAEPTALEVTSTLTALFCPEDLANADITISGGTAPYFVTWTLPGGGTSTLEDLVNVVQGTYDLFVQDSNGCEYTETFDLVATNVLTATSSVSPLDCTGNPIASINLDVSGGVQPYEFNWTSLNGFTSTDEDLSGLVADTYTVAIVDQAGCELVLDFVIDPVDILTVDGVATSPICFGETSGSIELDITGGVQPNVVTWTSTGGFSSSDEDIFNLVEDDYTVVVTDAENCSVTANYSLVEPAEIVVSSSTTTVVCPDEPISADITITGGGTPYNISWIDEDMNITTDEDLIDFPQGIYELIIEDQFGCVYQETFDLTAPGGLEASTTTTPLDCSGDPIAAIDLTVTDGIAPYDIVWSSLNGFSSTDEDISNLLADEYTATITDQGGCTLVLVVTIDQVDELIISGTVTDALCNDEFTGSIDLSLVGGIAPYTADWTGPIGFNSTDADITGLMAGTYDVIITDVTGCQKTAQFIVSEPQEVSVDLILSPVVCPDDLISVDATISGGTPGYVVLWTDPNGVNYNTEDLVDVPQGVYEVVITDALNCVAETSVGITPPNVLNIVSDVTSLDCSGNPIGAIDLTIAGGTPPYIVAWTSIGGFSSSDEDISGLTADTYTVTISDQIGCVLSADFELSPVQPLTADVTTVLPVCGGENSGQIMIEPTGGIMPYVFLWTGPNGFSSTDQNIDNIASGSYSVTITDDAGCFIVVPVDLDDLSSLVLTANITPVICRGDETGAIDLSISGGAAPYSVEWTAADFFSTDEDLVNLASREYLATVTDDNGCVVSEIFEVIELINIVLDFETTNSTCGNAEGEITVIATGGDEPLIYQWVDELGNVVGSDATISNLAAGTYTVTVTDANNCPMEGQVSISDSDGVQLDATQTDVSCAGLDNGSIDLIISGGTGATVVNWVGTNGFTSTDEDISGLMAGIYNAQVEDELGCLAFASIEIQISPNTLAVEGVASDLECGTTNTGSIDVTTAGGTGSLTFEWFGPNGFSETNEDLSNLEAGDYQVIVTDEETCSATATFTLLAFEAVNVEFVVTNVTCASGTDGAISTTVISGVAPFSFLWTGPNGFTSANSDIALLEAGDYSITVEDAEGCVFEQTLSVTDGNIIDIQILSFEPACLASDGILEAFVSGGNGEPYSYFWYDTDNGNALVTTDAEATNLFAGNYYLEVFDAQGCLATLDVPLSNSEGDLSTSITDVLCFGQANGAVDLTVNGLTAPYDFEWTDDEAFTADTEDISDLIAGNYTVDIIDAAGCFISGSYEVLQPAEIIIEVTQTDLLCNGVPEGAIDINIVGDAFDYVFDWSGPNGFTSTEQNLVDLEDGCYDLIVTGVNNCTAATQVCILTPDTLDVISIPTGIVCNGANTGSIEIEISGGTGAYTTQWAGPDGFASSDEDIFTLFAGQYDLQITDENGCSIQTSIQIDQSDAIVLVVDTIQPICPGESTGGFNATVSGGFGPYTLTWSDLNGVVGTGLSITGLSTGQYTVLVQDAAMCETTLSFDLQDPDPIEVDSVVLNVNCNGQNDGSIELDITGGTEPYSTFWVGPNGYNSTAEDIFNLEPGSYELTLGDDVGCVVTQQFQIEEPELLEVSITEVVDATCLTSTDGSISIAITGGVQDYVITWTDENANVQNTQNLENVGPGLFDVMVVDANGCSFSATGLSIGFTGDAVADAGSDLQLCDGEMVSITGQNNGSTATWWEDSDGNQIATTDILTATQGIGESTYIYFVQDGDCIVSDEVTVIVNPLPEVDAGLDHEAFTDETTTIGGNPTTDSNNLIVWSPSDLLQSDDDQNPETIELSQSTYFYVEVTDINGCSATDSTFVLIIPSIDVPSGFTPNGDAMNDQWIIANVDFYPNIQVNIYSRWGEEVFSSNGYTTPWDGTYNGDPLPIGTYYYVIEVNEPQFENPITGPVTIVR